MSIGFKLLPLNEKRATRRRHLYEGKTKTLFDGPEPGTFVLYFKDTCQQQADFIVRGKGVINNRLSEMFMIRLNDIGIQTHFINRLNMREQLVRATEALPFYLVIHNVASQDFSKRLNLEEGTLLPEAIPEFYMKNKELSPSFISERHIISLGWADEEELERINTMNQRINDFLCGQFLALGLRLISYKLEYGRNYLSDYIGDSQIVLIDEISIDTCSILDIKTGQQWDGQALTADNFINSDQRSIYHKLAERFGLLNEGGPVDLLTKDETL